MFDINSPIDAKTVDIDIANVKQYVKHYNLAEPEYLFKGFDQFKAGIIESKDLRLLISKWITSDKHFTDDPAWERPVKQAMLFLQQLN